MMWDGFSVTGYYSARIKLGVAFLKPELDKEELYQNIAIAYGKFFEAFAKGNSQDQALSIALLNAAKGDKEKLAEALKAGNAFNRFKLWLREALNCFNSPNLKSGL